MSKDHKKNQDMSVEEILRSIKGVIDSRANTIGTDEDILELTNVVVDQELGAGVSNNVFRPSLVSEESAAEATNMFQQLIKTIKEPINDNIKLKVTELEDLAVEIMRPQLSRWLNENLPLLVKQLVEEEIKKLVPNDKK